MGPLKRYQEAFSAGRWMPTLQVTNYMNHEAILQVPALAALTSSTQMHQGRGDAATQQQLCFAAYVAGTTCCRVALMAGAMFSCRGYAKGLSAECAAVNARRSRGCQRATSSSCDLIWTSSTSPACPYFIALDRDNSKTIGEHSCHPLRQWACLCREHHLFCAGPARI